MPPRLYTGYASALALPLVAHWFTARFLHHTHSPHRFLDRVLVYHRAHSPAVPSAAGLPAFGSFSFSGLLVSPVWICVHVPAAFCAGWFTATAPAAAPPRLVHRLSWFLPSFWFCWLLPGLHHFCHTLGYHPLRSVLRLPPADLPAATFRFCRSHSFAVTACRLTTCRSPAPVCCTCYSMLPRTHCRVYRIVHRGFLSRF